MEFDLAMLLMLAGVALLAGFFDAIAGGGGLITLPALMLAGMDPVAAIATNKFQATAATVSATITYSRKGMIDWRPGFPMAVMSMFGGAAGALSISYLPREWLQIAVPVLLLLVAAYFALSPTLHNREREPYISIIVFTVTLAPLIGFYDGVFGPGVGSFFMVAFVWVMGQGILRAVSNSKLLNASCNLGALAIFSVSGNIVLPVALCMAFAAFLGAQAGARCATRFGPRLIKPLLIVICCSMAIKLLVG